MTTLTATEAGSLLAERGGLNNDMATRRLKELVKAGELEEHPALWRGKRVTAYRRA